MRENEQKRAAKKFVERWITETGYEKGQTQLFWTALLRDVFGVAQPEDFIEFEDQVKLESTKFIDARIPSTKVLIEQKGSHVDLTAKVKQSDGSSLTPFEQARRYVAGLPLSEHPRWIVVCNFREFHVHDMERPSEPPQIVKLENLEKECYRLRFLVDSGSSMTSEEMQVSFDAGKLVGEIYDALLEQYKRPNDPHVLRSLNILCVRLVFCLYAEDAGLFNSHTQFHDYLKSLPVGFVKDGLTLLFKTLNTKEEERDTEASEELNAFPYVNGGLFAEENISIPQFNKDIVDLLLNKASAGFDWSRISPTIFGAVFESTLNTETRQKGGMHYTSVENIHKVIDPLFLSDLKQQFSDILKEKVTTYRTRKLRAFQDKLASLTFLDPACGSGNFLTETYISLRRLENDVIRAILSGQALLGFDELDPVKVSISQFFGIEINDFAVSVAQTALWIAESQMLKETEDIINRNLDFFPLKSLTNIVEGNALRLDWEEVVQADRLDFIMGNPPFIGARLMPQGSPQKKEIEDVFGDIREVQDLDYVCGWFKKAAELASQHENLVVAFVATNSICQGAQVPVLWSELYKLSMHINFAYRTFKWHSEATDQAAVHCVIVAFSKKMAKSGKIFSVSSEGSVSEEIVDGTISPYLTKGAEIFVSAQKKPLCAVPEMNFGNQPRDGGFFVIADKDKDSLLSKYTELAPYVRPYIGAEEFIRGKKRWCLWLKQCPLSLRSSNPYIKDTVRKVKEFRLSSKAKTTNGYAKVPHLFAQITQPDDTPYLIVPSVSSERRLYVPIGFVDGLSISSNAVQIVPNASLYHFGILTSSVHMAWMRAVSGRLEMRYRYSKELVYNTFVWPRISEKQKYKIEQAASKILDSRKRYNGSTMAMLYDPEQMPVELYNAHVENDRAVLAAYGLKSAATEEEIVSHLMELYVRQVAEVKKKSL